MKLFENIMATIQKGFRFKEDTVQMMEELAAKFKNLSEKEIVEISMKYFATLPEKEQKEYLRKYFGID